MERKHFFLKNTEAIKILGSFFSRKDPMLISESRAYLRAFFTGSRSSRLALAEMKRVSPRLSDPCAAPRPASLPAIPRQASRSRIYADGPCAAGSKRAGKAAGSKRSGRAVGSLRTRALESVGPKRAPASVVASAEEDPGILMIRSLSDLCCAIEPVDDESDWSLVLDATCVDAIPFCAIGPLGALTAPISLFDFE